MERMFFLFLCIDLPSAVRTGCFVVRSPLLSLLCMKCLVVQIKSSLVCLSDKLAMRTIIQQLRLCEVVSRN